MTTKRKHLQVLLSIKKNWDFMVRGNTGTFTNKVILHTGSKELIMNQDQLNRQIRLTKSNVAKTKRRFNK